MSSIAVRNLVKDFIEDSFPSYVLIDLTLEFAELSTLMSDNDVQPGAPWLGVTFIGDEERPISLSADNTKGLYREIGAFEIHIVAEAKIGVGSSILSRAEDLRNAFRGQRLGAVVVEAVSPVNTDPGATLEFEGGYVSGTIRVDYHYDMTPSV